MRKLLFVFMATLFSIPAYAHTAAEAKKCEQLSVKAAVDNGKCSEYWLCRNNAQAGRVVGNNCIATKCDDGAFFVYKNNAYQGWCVYPSYCNGRGELKTFNSDMGMATDLTCEKGTSDGKSQSVSGLSCSDADLKKLHAKSGFITANDNTEMPPVCIPNECEDGAYMTFETPDDPVVRCVYPSEVCDDDEILETLDYGYTTLKCLPKSAAGDGNSGNVSNPVGGGNAEKKIADLKAKYDELTTKYFDPDRKWRNADGKFNTARLASDGVAGVVLGTTAGLITAHVVKKGQIKNGYEDIICSIGGQKVSDWNDELVVGVQ